jgi:hypothetical protein
MKTSYWLSLFACALLWSAPVAMSQGDVITHRLGYDGNNSNDFRYYGQSSGIAAYSMASQSCNIGDQVLDWYGSGVRHPVIGQNIFRLKDGVFEQLGQSWLKHSFCALSEPGCGNCQSTGCNTLGIGCADTYWASLNDGSGGGPKYQVNALDGSHAHPFDSPSGSSSIRGRLQVAVSDMDPSQNAGAEYFAEVQYIAKDDHEAGFAVNNASWRAINVNSVSNITGGGVTITQQAGIYAWEANDANVTLMKLTNANEMGSGLNGTFYVAHTVTNNGDGTYHYQYAVQNLTSDQSASSFAIPVESGITITNVDFRDVDYHSGEPYSGTDWSYSQAGGYLTWSTQTYSQNQNANAIRWGTLYAFGFDADAGPDPGTGTLGLFKPGISGSMSFATEGPGSCSAPYNYCTAAPNSVSSGAQVGATGSTSVGANAMQLYSWSCPPNQFGIFFYGPNQIQVAFGDGYRCVGGNLYRFGVVQTSIWGDVIYTVDLANPPQASGQVTSGSTWNYQFWFRDPTAGGGGPAGYNLSNGVSVTFCP